jgi:hypothetical protein
MIDISLPAEWFLNPNAIPLDPNVAKDWVTEIDWENLRLEPPPEVEPWVLDVMQEFVDLATNDPNVAPVLEWYLNFPAPGELLTYSVTVEIAEGITESMSEGYYDDWAFEAMVTYLYFTVDWGSFFDEYSSIF